MKKLLLIAIFAAIGTANVSSEAEPLPASLSQINLLKGLYSEYQEYREERYPVRNEIRGIYLLHEARQVCTNWRVQPQSEFNTCVSAVVGAKYWELSK